MRRGSPFRLITEISFRERFLFQGKNKRRIGRRDARYITQGSGTQKNYVVGTISTDLPRDQEPNIKAAAVSAVDVHPARA
jgi:hypothetical protein